MQRRRDRRETRGRGRAVDASAVVGRYILHPSVMNTLETQPPGSGGEIQLTDALAQQVGNAGPVRVPVQRASGSTAATSRGT